MVHVGVGQKHQINGRQLPGTERGGDETFGADRAYPSVSADAFAQHRIG